jgi:formate/nitrite transporter FocA (FNT family)
MEISRHLMGSNWLEMFFRAITAGFLIAAMVWLIPSAGTAQFYVVVLLTYLIAAGGFMHIIAGSMEAFMLLVNGDASWWSMVLQFIVPVLIGNIVVEPPYLLSLHTRRS